MPTALNGGLLGMFGGEGAAARRGNGGGMNGLMYGGGNGRGTMGMIGGPLGLGGALTPAMAPFAGFMNGGGWSSGLGGMINPLGGMTAGKDQSFADTINPMGQGGGGFNPMKFLGGGAVSGFFG